MIDKLPPRLSFLQVGLLAKCVVKDERLWMRMSRTSRAGSLIKGFPFPQS